MKALVYVWTFWYVCGAVIVVGCLTTILLAWIRDIVDSIKRWKEDYVSGKFLVCRKSFKEFREGQSYWLEYHGCNTYIGRSDNILNQRFHITPRQLKNFANPNEKEEPEP